MFGNLLSGLIGALIGGVLAYFGAVKSADKTIKANLKIRESEAATQATQRMSSALISYLAESEQNIKITSRWRVDNAKAKLSDRAWGIYSDQLQVFNLDLQLLLIEVYSDIIRYNSIVDYDMHAVSYGNGSVDFALTNEIDLIKPKLFQLKELLIMSGS